MLRKALITSVVAGVAIGLTVWTVKVHTPVPQKKATAPKIVMCEYRDMMIREYRWMAAGARLNGYAKEAEMWYSVIAEEEASPCEGLGLPDTE